MPDPVALRRALLPPGERGPALIAHGAGNSGALAAAGMAARADYLEIDLWVHRGRFEARHERRLALALPVLFEKWYVRGAPRAPYDLSQLLAAAPAPTGILLDLKNAPASAGPLARSALSEAVNTGPVLASSQHWPLLRALHRELPAVGLFYSIDVAAKLDLFLSVSERDHLPMGVSCYHRLLTGQVVADLRTRGLVVIAWTVDDQEEAARLVAMGVDGITTHRIVEMRERFGRS